FRIRFVVNDNSFLTEVQRTNHHPVAYDTDKTIVIGRPRTGLNIEIILPSSHSLCVFDDLLFLPRRGVTQKQSASAVIRRGRVSEPAAIVVHLDRAIEISERA